MENPGAKYDPDHFALLITLVLSLVKHYYNMQGELSLIKLRNDTIAHFQHLNNNADILQTLILGVFNITKLNN